jgi:hypothetical protein
VAHGVVVIVEALAPNQLLDEVLVQAHVHGAGAAIEGADVRGDSGKVEVQQVVHNDSFCVDRSCGILLSENTNTAVLPTQYVSPGP